MPYIEKKIPAIISGGKHADYRGVVSFNNAFNALEVKRMYTIENKELAYKRGWQGHKIEQRWFIAIHGAFKIQILSIEYFENGKRALKPFQFELKSDKMDILHVPAGFVSSIQALEIGAKLLILADFNVGEVDDEFRFEFHPNDF